MNNNDWEASTTKRGNTPNSSLRGILRGSAQKLEIESDRLIATKK